MAKSNPNFINLVYPIAFRGVLQRLIEHGDLEYDGDSWITQWLRFINSVLSVKTEPQFGAENGILSSDQELWIDECVNEYCKKFKVIEKFTSQ